MSLMQRALVCVVLTALVGAAVGPVSVAMAEPSPTVTSVTPNSGSTAGGTPVTIIGSGFAAGVTVTIGDAATEVVINSETEITARTAATVAGPAEVVVSDVSGTSTLGPTYTYIAPPTPPMVESITPASGSTAGGTPVTIIGSGFVTGSTVAIGGNTASQVSVASETEITAKTPVGSAGSAGVVVADANGTSSGGPSYTFVIPPPTVESVTPTSGSTVGGTPVTITGSGFVAGSTVTIGSAVTEVVVRSETEITAKTAATAAGPAEVMVSNENGASTLGPSYTYIAPPPPPSPPTVTLNVPTPLSNNRMPSFTGTASDTTPVTVQIYEGATATGSIATATGTGGVWTSDDASPALAGGRHTYMAVASQESTLGNLVGVSSPVIFTVDTTSPTVSLNQPASPSNNRMPSFAGSASDTTSVTVEIYEGATAMGSPVSRATAAGTGGGWASGEASPMLADGKHTYTAIATQKSSLGNPEGVSNPVTFVVDTAAPTVSLNQPASPSSDTTPSFTGSASESTVVTVQIYAGATVQGAVLATATATGTDGGWISGEASASLADGRYTAIASQEILVEGHVHVGESLPVTFTVDTVLPNGPVVPTGPASPTPPATPTPSPAPTPPAAAFTWVPEKPTTGQSVALVSSSTDADSPLTVFAWDLAGSGTFTAGGPVITTSFSTPGNHTVRLRVTDANGLTSVATQTIAVSAAPLVLMQPFPVVRIAGSESASGVKISLLTVQAPVGTRVSVICGGRHCPSRSESRVVVSSRSNSKTGGVLLTFSKFERSLQAGVMLEIRVSKPGEIGKYTSFRIRPNKPPARVDACVGPANPKPIACPAS